MFKEYRKKRDYTQEQLAELVGVSWRTIQRIETEQSIPTLETFAKLVMVLKINNNDILIYLVRVSKWV